MITKMSNRTHYLQISRKTTTKRQGARKTAVATKKVSTRHTKESKTKYVYTGVPGGMCQTSGGSSLW
jgi:hypothetical protein